MVNKMSQPTITGIPDGLRAVVTAGARGNAVNDFG